MLKERRNSPRKQHGDFFDSVIEELNKEKSLITEPIALDLMFVLLFATFETTSQALTLAIKFLTDHPNEEHDTIIKNRENPVTGVTWMEDRSMAFTFQVITETARLANIVPGIFRKALKDIQINGLSISTDTQFLQDGESWCVLQQCI
ncbi:Cytochrome P450 [Musa troglodytarum]|uniref:Cytochrome P450 n=1 Tax=Musa troglodytarum TaxID=320322 RepID=A0A9E7G6W8_9LILI|nr:Cytochrome P450 [Musa troglodytarum]